MGLGLFRPSPDRYPAQQPGCVPAQTYKNGPPVNVNVTVAPPPFLNLPNPNPANWEILDDWWCGSAEDHYLVLKIRYPDCTNYEGIKILVYHNVKLQDLQEQKLIDPHFSDKVGWQSPIARYEPTDRGWEMAQRFCRMMLDKT